MTPDKQDTMKAVSDAGTALLKLVGHASGKPGANLDEINEAAKILYDTVLNADDEIFRLRALLTAEESGKAGDAGYIEAFYEIAKMLGVGARPYSAKETFERDMKPRLTRLLTTPAHDEPEAGGDHAEALEQIGYIKQALDNALLALTEIKSEVFKGEPISGRSQMAGDKAIQHVTWATCYIPNIVAALASKQPDNRTIGDAINALRDEILSLWPDFKGDAGRLRTVISKYIVVGKQPDKDLIAVQRALENAKEKWRVNMFNTAHKYVCDASSILNRLLTKEG